MSRKERGDIGQDNTQNFDKFLGSSEISSSQNHKYSNKYSEDRRLQGSKTLENLDDQLNTYKDYKGQDPAQNFFQNDYHSKTHQNSRYGKRKSAYGDYTVEVPDKRGAPSSKDSPDTQKNRFSL